MLYLSLTDLQFFIELDRLQTHEREEKTSSSMKFEFKNYYYKKKGKEKKGTKAGITGYRSTVACSCKNTLD